MRTSMGQSSTSHHNVRPSRELVQPGDPLAVAFSSAAGVHARPTSRLRRYPHQSYPFLATSPSWQAPLPMSLTCRSVCTLAKSLLALTGAVGLSPHHSSIKTSSAHLFCSEL
jgi:hypothetical protein